MNNIVPTEPAVSHPALLDWKTVSTKLPWGPVIIIGGGYALAEGCNVRLIKLYYYNNR